MFHSICSSPPGIARKCRRLAGSRTARNEKLKCQPAAVWRRSPAERKRGNKWTGKACHRMLFQPHQEAQPAVSPLWLRSPTVKCRRSSSVGRCRGPPTSRVHKGGDWLIFSEESENIIMTLTEAWRIHLKRYIRSSQSGTLSKDSLPECRASRTADAIVQISWGSGVCRMVWVPLSVYHAFVNAPQLHQT